MKIISRIMVLCLTLMLAACASQKTAVGEGGGSTTSTSGSKDDLAARQLKFVQKVSDQKVYARNIVADMTFTATFGDEKVSVPGKLSMRKDEVVRIQLFVPILGTEVGRLEFAPDYVLVLDRYHKQYIKGDYTQLDFLRDNGLNFYSLQALFWNQLLLPGTSRVGEGDLQQFAADIDGMGENVPITYDKGNMHYVWTAGRQTGLISQTDVSYTSQSHGKSQLQWLYTNFKSLGSKKFPATQTFSFTTTASDQVETNSIKLEMKELTTTDKWETETTVSDKYKKIEAEDIFGKLLEM